MKKIFFLILCAMSLMAHAQSLSVGQYNIRFDKAKDKENGNGWDTRSAGIYRLINYEAWDIFGAQEVLHNQLEDMLDNITGYDYIGVGRDDGAAKGEYAPIFYKKNRISCVKSGHFWLSETPDKVGSVGWDAALCRLCTWGYFEDKNTKWRFWAFNLHMDHVGEVARRESAKLVLSKIKEMCGSEPYILTGDFNVDQNDTVYTVLTASGALNDAYSIAAHRMCETGSMNYFNPDYNTDSRIDHIFLSSHFKVRSFGLLTYNYWAPVEVTPEKVKAMSEGVEGVALHKSRMLSDHYPVEAVVELPRLRSTQDWAQYSYYSDENKNAENVKVVFMGNSITRNWFRYRPEFFKENDGYLCRGISGQVTAQMLARFRSDVINLRPRVVVILAGTNDIAMNQGYVSIEHIYENIVSMAELAKCNGIKVVLCSVLPADKYTWSWEIDKQRAVNSIKKLNELLQAYAKKNKIPYADYYSAMIDENMALKKEYQEDAVHPNKAGYLLMEGIVQKILKKQVK